MVLFIVLAVIVVATLIGWKVLLDGKKKKEMEAYRSIAPVAPSQPPVAPNAEVVQRS